MCIANFNCHSELRQEATKAFLLHNAWEGLRWEVVVAIVDGLQDSPTNLSILQLHRRVWWGRHKQHERVHATVALCPLAHHLHLWAGHWN